jgi:hypothetical protein
MHIPATTKSRSPPTQATAKELGRNQKNSQTQPGTDSTDSPASKEQRTSRQIEIREKIIPRSCLLPIAARTHVPHVADKGRDHLPLNDTRSIIDKKEREPPTAIAGGSICNRTVQIIRAQVQKQSPE